MYHKYRVNVVIPQKDTDVNIIIVHQECAAAACYHCCGQHADMMLVFVGTSWPLQSKQEGRHHLQEQYVVSACVGRHRSGIIACVSSSVFSNSACLLSRKLNEVFQQNKQHHGAP